MIKKLKIKKNFQQHYVSTERVPLHIQNLQSLIKYMRLSRGYTQEEAAKALGTVRQHVQKWEYGIIKPCPRNMQQILSLFRYESYNDVVCRYYV